MISKKKVLSYGTIVGLSVIGLSTVYSNYINDESNVVLAESTVDGYSNVLNFTAKSKVSESNTTTTQHEPMDLIQIIDLSGSLSDFEFKRANGVAGGRKQQINDMIYVIENKLTDEDHVMLAFYGTNTEDSYKLGDREGSDITRLLTKKEAIELLKELNSKDEVHNVSLSSSLIRSYVSPLLESKNYSVSKNFPLGTGFEDVYKAQPNRNKQVSVLQFTDDWTVVSGSNENIDTSFADWAKSNAKTFMTVVDTVIGSDALSVSQLKKAGHPNIKVFTKLNTPNRQEDIAKLFESTATVTKKTTSTIKQKGNVTITPDADLKLKSAELVGPNGSKINLKIENNKVIWNGDLDDGSYKLNYTFEGKPYVERSIRGVVSIDGKKVDEKINIVKPEKISFETKYENDSSLANGVEKEKQPGIEGLKYVITRDGKVAKTNIEKQKQDRIILRGTKGSDKEVVKQKIPFETKYIEDKNLEVGKTRVVTEGVEGEKEITKTYVTQSGKRVGEPSVSEKVVKDKVDKVIAKGTKGSDKEVVKQKIPFETKYIEDKNLEVGKTRVVTEGVEGEKEITKTYVTQSGKRVGEPSVSEKVVKDKVDKVIAKGTKGSDVDSSISDIPFKIIYKEDKNLEFGKKRVDIEGVTGKLSTTKTYVTQSGKRVGETTISNKVTINKVDKVISVGTKPVVTTKELDFKTTYVEDKELEAKKQEVRTEGKKGTETTTQTYSFNAETGNVTENEPKLDTTAAVDKVIAVGMKPVVTMKELDFKTTYVEDKELEAKKQEVRTEGKKGTETTTQTYSFNAETGDVTENEPKVDTTAAVDKVIAVGTKPVVTTKELDFKTTYVEDKELEAKKQEVRTEGKKGTETTTQTYSFNAETGNVTENEPKLDTTAAVDKVIAVGTKPVVTMKELDFKTERRENKNMKKGDEKIIQKGEKGLETTTQTYRFNAETGEVIENKPEVELKKPVDQIIEYGVNEGKQLPQTNNNGLVGASIAGFIMVLSTISTFIYKRFKK